MTITVIFKNFSNRLNKEFFTTGNLAKVLYLLSDNRNYVEILPHIIQVKKHFMGKEVLKIISSVEGHINQLKNMKWL